MKKLDRFIAEKKRKLEQTRAEEKRVKKQKESFTKENPAPIKKELCKNGNNHISYYLSDKEPFEWIESYRACKQCENEIDCTSRIKSCLIPKRFINSKPTTEYFNIIQDGDGVFINGDVGTGKTYLLCGIIKELAMKGILPKFDSYGNIAREIRTSIKDGKYNEVYKNYAEQSVLVIDDIGTGQNSEFMKEFVYNIINDRYNSMKPILMTTNLTSKEFTNEYSQRVLSRIKEMCKIIKLNGEDLRK